MPATATATAAATGAAGFDLSQALPPRYGHAMKHALLLILCLSACTSFPSVDAVAAHSTAPPPALLPTEELLAQTGAIGADAAGQTLAARAAALRARAAALRNR